ncbi:MAG: class I SAM-dependent methyltransferase [Actinomycetota bacterium]
MAVHSSLLDVLLDPISRGVLTLEEHETEGDEVITGRLLAESGHAYPIENAIPRFVVTKDPGQAQTQSSFGYKWARRDSYGSKGMQSELYAWLLDRYGFESPEAMREYFGSRRCILDTGCGAGFATSAWMAKGWNTAGGRWVGADISAAIDVAHSRLGAFDATHFVQADIFQQPFRPASFDAIFAEGVLHHTPSTRRAFETLVPLLAPGGELMIYVYRRKAPLREFADDHVRDLLAEMAPEEAWEAVRPLTRLGQALAELETEVEVPEGVPLLGIEAGCYDVHRLIYWNVAKLFWNPKLTFEENNHLNFDWYAPRYAHRHTEEEVRGWYEQAGLEVTRFHVHEAGFTVRGVKS